MNLVVRLPRALHAALVRLSQRDMRSLNSEMLFLLRQDVVDAGEDPDAEPPAAKQD